mmetsp:Transcript_14410/g.38201  ORF Transcript_14410/g.38201 Transcript_14410/m.38201 type:complete len:210 (+) Transcript_14410:445-1074(+)
MAPPHLSLFSRYARYSAFDAPRIASLKRTGSALTASAHSLLRRSACERDPCMTYPTARKRQLLSLSTTRRTHTLDGAGVAADDDGATPKPASRSDMAMACASCSSSDICETSVAAPTTPTGVGVTFTSACFALTMSVSPDCRPMSFNEALESCATFRGAGGNPDMSDMHETSSAHVCAMEVKRMATVAVLSSSVRTAWPAGCRTRSCML